MLEKVNTLKKTTKIICQIFIQEMDKAKHEYHELQKTIQQISTKNTTEKSKL